MKIGFICFLTIFSESVFCGIEVFLIEVLFELFVLFKSLIIQIFNPTKIQFLNRRAILNNLRNGIIGQLITPTQIKRF